MGKLKLQQLGGPRAVLLYDDAAFEEPCNNPGDAPPAPPERAGFESQAAFEAALERHPGDLAAYERAKERFAAWERYTEFYDPTHLDPFIKPGEKPVVFMVKALPPEAAAAILDFPDREHGARALHAVKYGVVDILNLEVADENGTPMGFHKVKRIQGEYGLALDEVTLSLFANQVVLVQVSTHVFAASRLPRGVSKSR